MLSCHNFPLDDYLDGSLSRGEAEHCLVHLDQCSHCAQKLVEARSLQKELREMASMPIPADFNRRQFDRFWQQYDQKPAAGRRRWMMPAMAAAVLALVMVAGLSYRIGSSGPALPEEAAIAISVDEVKEVRFAVSAKKQMENVRLTLSLPANVELAGRPGTRELNWTTSLEKGANVLALPLKAAQAGQGKVVVKIHSPSGKQTQKVLRMDISGEPASKLDGKAARFTGKGAFYG